MGVKRNNKLIGISFLRFLAILGVVFYHVNPRFIKGGFLGVNLFLVISGYLLVNSLEKSKANGPIKIFKEMGKRIRKLLPHLFLMISAVIIFMMVFNKTMLESSKSDALAGMTFTSNIWYILKKVSYFDAAGNTPFKHLWYLGFQVQFYLTIIILYKFTSDKKIYKNFNLFFYLGLGIGLISLIAHIYLYSPDNINRIYYGFDTRLFTPMIGVLGAYIFPLEKLREKGLFTKMENNRKYLNLLSLAMILIFIGLNIWVGDYSSWLYRGGFLLIDIFCLGLIVLLSSRFNSAVKYFNRGLVKVIDKLSYPLYIWHFPILILTATQAELRGPKISLTIFRLVICIVLVILVEAVQNKTIYKNNKSLLVIFLENLGLKKYKATEDESKASSQSSPKYSLKIWIKRAYLVLFILGLIGFSFPWISSTFVADNSVKMDDSFVAGEIKDESDKLEPQTEDKKFENGQDLNNENLDEVSTDENSKLENQASQSPRISPNLKTIVLIGDSIGVNVGPELVERFENTIVDTAISRQLYRSYDIAQKYSHHDSPNNALVLMLGTNGMFTRSHVDKITSYYPQSKIYFVNIYTPGTHETELNNFLNDLARENDRINVVDWHSIASAHPEILEPDATHIKYGKAGFLVDEILRVINENQ